jgi:septal ring factor EnvC (AmiA/AmiB activator)
VKPVPLGQVSKGELRAQIEKLELANAKLRARNREAGREAKLSANRIAELEKQVAQLEKKLKPKASPIASPDKGTKTRRLAKAVPAVPEVGAPSDAGNAENQSLDRDVTPAGEAEPDR